MVANAGGAGWINSKRMTEGIHSAALGEALNIYSHFYSGG
jgi:hypothetical protein